MSPEFKNLQAVIVSFFREVYGHDLKHDKVNDLCDFLVARIRVSEIQYFLEHNGHPLGDPDSKFSETRILDFFKSLYPVLLERKKDEYLQVFLKGILNPLLIQINKQNQDTLSGCFRNNSQFNLAMTAYSNVSFLGRSEFDIARSFNEIDKELSERYFRKSLASLLKAREISIRPTDRFNYGMVGVAYHYISLSATSPAEKKMLLSEAISNMQAAEELGDYSTDHFQYLGFSLFEFACIENKLSDYFRALDILEICYDKNSENSNGIVSLARCNLNIGINYSLQRDNKSVQYLKNAVFLFDELLAKKHLINKTYPLHAIIGRRSQALFFLWNSTHENVSILEECVADLKYLVEQDADNYWTHTLVNALIEKFLIQNDVNDLLYAKKISDHKSSLNIPDVEYWRQRGRLYLCYGNSLSEPEAYGLFEISIECFQRCMSDLEEESKGYLGLAHGFRGLQFRIESDLRKGIDYLKGSTYHEMQESEKIGILPRLYRELAQLVAKLNPAESIQLFQYSIDALKSKELSKFEKSPAVISEITSMIGATYLYKFNLSCETDDIINAYHYMCFARDFGMNDPTFYGIFGQICLNTGKSSSDIYEQNDSFMEAAEFFKKSFELGNIDSSNFSKWGEALFRLNRVNKRRWSLKEALNKFLESFKRGNNSSENLGLIGDCYYQLSRIEDPVKNLNKALEYKELAKAKGHLSKENASVSGRISLMLYFRTRDIKYFNEGVKSIFNSHNIDKSWPWPICQLAEVTRDFEREIISNTESLNQLTDDKQLLQTFLNRKTNDLWIQGARLTLNQKTVKQEILGGKSKVFVKKDPYGLISSTFVFKPGDDVNPKFSRFSDKGLEKLTKEKQRVVSFGDYLLQFNKKEFLLPTPLEIFSLDENIFYSMLRVNGRELGEILLYEDDNRLKDECIKMTIEYLSIFHSWHQQNVSIPNPYQLLTNPVRSILNSMGNSFIPLAGVGDSILNKCWPFEKVIRGLPLVEKKDAHPENWLVTEDNNIIMIDIEEPVPRFKYLLDDLVQLIDDYPYLPYTATGWESRKELIQQYLSNLNYYNKLNNKVEVQVETEFLNMSYLALLYFRALFIIGLTNRKVNSKGHSESSLSKWSLRNEHAFSLLRFVEISWTTDLPHIETPYWLSLNKDIELLKKFQTTKNQER